MVDGFLKKAGYKVYDSFEEYAARSFQKAFKESDEEGFININHYDMTNINMGHRYDVGVNFETKLDEIWFDCKYYNLSEKQLIRLLLIIEQNLKLVFNKLGVCDG